MQSFLQNTFSVTLGISIPHLLTPGMPGSPLLTLQLPVSPAFLPCGLRCPSKLGTINSTPSWNKECTSSVFANQRPECSPYAKESVTNLSKVSNQLSQCQRHTWYSTLTVLLLAFVKFLSSLAKRPRSNRSLHILKASLFQEDFQMVWPSLSEVLNNGDL